MLRMDVTKTLLNYLYKDLQGVESAGYEGSGSGGAPTAAAGVHKMPSGYAMYGITVTLC